MIELYLDTADIGQIKDLASILPLKGITTNPTILAKSGNGLTKILSELNTILGNQARYHVQVISISVKEIIAEALQLAQLPYDIVVKIPANETGLIAIREIKKQYPHIKILATAIYTVPQGFTAALAGADYLAPYVNRIETMGGDGVETVGDLQLLLNKYQLKTKILAASFKNVQQVVEVLKIGIGAITIPSEVAYQLFTHPVIDMAMNQFTQDWQGVFGDKLSYET